MPYGTLTTLDTLATTQATIAKIGEDQAFAAVEAARAIHNQLLMNTLADLVEDTTDRQRRYGGADNSDFDTVDQMGRADASKLAEGQNVGFPLRKSMRTLQWNREYFENVTGVEFAGQVNGILDADARNVYRSIRRAIFNPTNVNFTDVLVDNVVLPIKAFVNADSLDLPVAQDGTFFNSATHTHFLASASANNPTQAEVDALLNTVREHYTGGMLMLEINIAQQSMFQTGGICAAGFAPYQDVRVIPATTGAVARGVDLDTINMYNRAIGVYNGAEVWVKPRIPAGYLFAWVKGQPKPLVFRRPERNPARGDLRMVADNETYPLRAQSWERNFGLSVWNRTNGAVLDTTHTTYTAPAIS